MDFKYIFQDEFDSLFKTVNITADSNSVKALAIPSYNTAYIVLSNRHWKTLLTYGNEKLLIDTLCRTIVHETIHLLIESDWSKQMGYKYDGEEKVCRLMAGQMNMGIEHDKEDLEMCKVCKVSKMNHSFMETHDFVSSDKYYPA